MAQRKPHRKNKLLQPKTAKGDPVKRSVSSRSVKKWMKRAQAQTGNRPSRELFRVILSLGIAFVLLLLMGYLLHQHDVRTRQQNYLIDSLG